MNIRFFPAFFDHPQRLRFIQQEQEEIIELFLRRHWVTNVPWLFITTVGLLFPPLGVSLNPVIKSLLNVDLLNLLPGSFEAALFILWYLGVLAYTIENFLHWYFNIYIVTNLHLVDINFGSILRRDILEAGLENVESASSEIAGIISSLFNFGDVVIETAAENQNITFLAVPFPDRVVDRVNDLIQDREKLKNAN